MGLITIEKRKRWTKKLITTNLVLLFQCSDSPCDELDAPREKVTRVSLYVYKHISSFYIYFTVGFYTQFMYLNHNVNICMNNRNNSLLYCQGLRGNLTDACERNDPCQHGGICISTDSGPLCECRNLEYEGTYCERGELYY